MKNFDYKDRFGCKKYKGVFSWGIILLSFAPSAAAGWHGERPRIPYARNGAWHSAFSSVGLCRRFLNQNCVRNKTACAKGGMLVPWWLGRFFVTGDSALFRYWWLGRFFRYSYLHTCIPTYLHTCIPAYPHTCIPANLHTCIPACLKKSLHAHFASVVNEFWMDFEVDFATIWNPFWGPFWNLGGGLGGSWVLEAPKLGFWSILDRFWDPSWGQVGSNFEALERPGASWHLLGRSLCGLEPFFFRSHDQFLFASHFTSISDRKTTPKSLKNRWRIHAHMKQKKKAYFHASCSELSR